MIVLKQNIAVLLSLPPDNINCSTKSTQHEAHKSIKTEVEQKRKSVKLIFVPREHSAGSAKRRYLISKNKVKIIFVAILERSKWE